MTIAHHPADSVLASYAAGGANEALGLLVASHLSYCVECADKVRVSEASHGVVRSDAPPLALERTAFESILSRFDKPVAATIRRTYTPSVVPAALQAYVGTDFDRLAWRPIAPGLSHYPFLTAGGVKARLIRAEPGTEVAEHTHRGEEWTLILTGAYRDVTGRYATGEVQSARAEIAHAPRAEPGPVCINLTVNAAPLVFKSWLPRLIGKLHGF